MGHKLKPKPDYTYRDSFPAFEDGAAFRAGEPRGYIVAYSGGSDSVHGDSIVWIRLNGNYMRIRIGQLPSLITGETVIDADGRVYTIPDQYLEVMTASSESQNEAVAVFCKVTRVIQHRVDSGYLLNITIGGHESVITTPAHSLMLARRGWSKRDKTLTWKVCPAVPEEIKTKDQLFRCFDYGFDCQDNPELPDWLLRLTGLWISDGNFAGPKGARANHKFNKICIATGNNQDIINFLKEIPRPPSKSEIAFDVYNTIRDRFPSHDKAIEFVSQALCINKGTVNTASYGKNLLRSRESGPFIRIKIRSDGEVTLCNKELVNRLCRLGLTGLSLTKRMPHWAFSLSKRQTAVLLAGYFDGDGHIGSWWASSASINIDLSRDVRELMCRLGIKSGMTKAANTGFPTKNEFIWVPTVGTTYGMRRLSTVPTHKTRNIALDGTIKPRSIYAFGCKSVKSVLRVPVTTPQTVFDLEVEDNHMFVANGILVHNSNCVLDMAVKVTEDANLVQPFIMSMLPSLDYYQFWREFAFRRWQVRVREYQHWALSWLIRRGIFRPYADPTFPRVILTDVERVVRQDTGLRWICYGYKSIDSLQRRGMMAGWQYGIGWERSVFAPLKDWAGYHTKAYLAHKRLGQPLDPAYRSTGIDTSPQCMAWLRQYWPDDYKRMLKVFPLAVAQADRWERFQAVRKNSSKAAIRIQMAADMGAESVMTACPEMTEAYGWKPKGQLDDLPQPGPRSESRSELDGLEE